MRLYILKGGRVTLIRSTLSSLPLDFISLLCLTRLVCSRLERIQRDFLSGGGDLDKKPHFVNWIIVCSNKKKGGLGITSYVARTRVRVSDTGTYLRVGFLNFQNLEDRDTNDKYPKFGYGCGGVFDKNKEILYKLCSFGTREPWIYLTC